MDPVAIERQKARESSWVHEGAQRFLRSLDDPTVSPGGRRIMKLCLERFTKALQDHLETTCKTALRPLVDPLVPALTILGAQHVAGVTLQWVIEGVMKSDRGRGSHSHSVFLSFSRGIGSAIEHDLRFRRWSKGAEKSAVRRMKAILEQGDRKTWRKREAALKRVAESQWSDEVCAVIGLDLQALLVKACPDVFEARTFKSAGKTLRSLRLSQGAAEELEEITMIQSVSFPKRGMMIVPPMDWRYSEGSQ